MGDALQPPQRRPSDQIVRADTPRLDRLSAGTISANSPVPNRQRFGAARHQDRRTSPTTQVAAPLDWTVSTRIGSLKSGPMKVWPTINGGLWPVMLRPYAA